MKLKTSRAKTGIFAMTILMTSAFSLGLMGSPGTAKVENGIYSDYTRSVLDDGDLNIINQVDARMRWMVTKTYNHPDMREHGVAVLWLPFFLYAKLLKNARSFGSFPGTTQEDMAVTLATVFMALVSMIIAVKLASEFFGTEYRWQSAIGFSFGTPMFWYAIFEPSGTDLVSNFVLTLVVLFFLALHETRAGFRYWALFGGLLAFAACVKIHCAFYAALLVMIFLQKEPKVQKQIRVRRFLFAVSGYFLIGLALLINNYVKWGEAGSPYWAMMSQDLSRFIPWTLLFGKTGYFWVTPIYLFAIFGAILWVSKINRISKGAAAEDLQSKNESRLAGFVYVPPLALLMTSVRPVGEELFGARQFLAQQIVFFLMFHYLLSQFKSRKSKVVFLWISGISVLWTLVMAARFFSAREKWGLHYLESFPSLVAQGGFALHYLSNSIRTLPELSLAFLGWTPVIIALGVVLTRVLQAKSLTGSQALRNLSMVSLFFVSLYLLVTALNAYFNPINVARMKKADFFRTSVVASGMDAYIYDDVLSVVPELIRYAQASENPRQVDWVIGARNRYIARVIPEIEVDPIGFKNDLKKGKVRPSWWDISP